MRMLATLLTLAFLCGVCRPEDHKTKHFQTEYAWSAMDFAFPDEEARNKSLQDGSFIPGNSIPFALDVDPETGRIFLALLKLAPGVPASLGTISATKNDKEEHLIQPYPDWSWHTRSSCDGITSVENIDIDDCGRLWVMDTGTVYLEGIYGPKTLLCHPEILVFDLKTNQLIKRYTIPDSYLDHETLFSNIAVEVISTEHECEDAFAYLSDSGNFGMVVYDFAKNESWMFTANEMYPYPEYGVLSIKGQEAYMMYGVYSMALSPMDSEHGRTLYFNSFNSGKESFVRTSVLRNKDNFHIYNHASTEFKTHPVPRPGGITGPATISENGVMFFNSMKEMSVYCWNLKSEHDLEHMVEVDRDDEAFQMFGDMTLVKKDGVTELYLLTNGFQKFIFGTPSMDEVHFRIMKASVEDLIQGTACVPNEDHSSH